MPKVLVADDSIAVRKVAERLLTEAGFGVTLAANGEEALSYLAKEKPDLIVSDVIMPDKSGYEVCAFVRELRSVDLYKAPGVAETLDWISSLLALKQLELVEGPVRDTLGALLKYQDDVLKVGGNDLYKILQKARGVS